MSLPNKVIMAKDSLREIPAIINGMGSDEYLNNAWLELGDIRKYKFDNKMLHPEWEDEKRTAELIVETVRNPGYLHFFCKFVLNVEILPFQGVILDTLWRKQLPMVLATRGGSKSFCLALYCILRAVIQQGCKIVVVGASLRQSLVLYNYIEQIWNESPILRDICGGKNHAPKRDIHMAYWRCGKSQIIFLPLGSGDKIRGIRGNVIIADEFSYIKPDVFETVIRGFAAVKSDGLFGNVVKAFKENIAKDQGFDKDPTEDEDLSGTLMTSNQIVLAGTCSFQFNHLYKYYRQYRSIIETGGDMTILRQMFPDMPKMDDIDSRDYAILQIPYNFIPAGMMDDKILNQGRATMDPMIFDMEYSCIFSADSDGFYLASAIQAATCPCVTRFGKIDFQAAIYGAKEDIHVMGIDPASENDNFTINIGVCADTYRGVKYQWSTNRKTFEKMLRDKQIAEDIKDYNTFCVRHIRSLIRRFNIKLICLDEGGGGVSLKEGLKDPSKFLDTSDVPILDVEDTGDTNDNGLKILKMINFSDYQFRRDSHYGLRKDIMDKVLLFPSYNAADVEESINNAKISGDIFDRMDDCNLEILECKNECTFIKHSQTDTGKEKWDIPSIKGMNSEGASKVLKKDRFTSLLLMNWAGRIISQEVVHDVSKMGGVAKRGGNFTKTKDEIPFGSVVSGHGRKICF